MPEMRWRAWWISPVPSEVFFYETETKEQAVQVLDALAEFDLHRVRTGKAGDELSNVGGIEQWDSEGEWEDWVDLADRLTREAALRAAPREESDDEQ